MPVSMPCAGDRILTCQKRQVKSRDFRRRRNPKGGENGGAGEENSGEERHEGERKMKAGKATVHSTVALHRSQYTSTDVASCLFIPAALRPFILVGAAPCLGCPPSPEFVLLIA